MRDSQMNYRRLCAFTGASGTGKSTLLNLIEKRTGFKVIELSGRPYLPVYGDYVSNGTDSVNRRISYGSSITFMKSIMDLPDRNLFFSRCSIDKLAYGRALNVGADLHDLIEKEINEIVIPNVEVFYLPVEFPLTDADDEVRGMNEEVRNKTDFEIRNILKIQEVPHTVVKGSIEERMEIILNKLM